MRYALVELGHVLIASTLFTYIVFTVYLLDVFDKIFGHIF